MALGLDSAAPAASQLLLGLLAAAWGWLAALVAAYERTVGTLAGALVGVLQGAVAACLVAGGPSKSRARGRAGLTRPAGRAAAAAAAERALPAELLTKGAALPAAGRVSFMSAS